MVGNWVDNVEIPIFKEAFAQNEGFFFVAKIVHMIENLTIRHKK